VARILLLLIIALLVWLALRIVAARSRRDDPPPREATPSRPNDVANAATNAVEPIAQCAWCGVHAPAGTAVSLPDGRVYCGPAHRDAARAASS
jgi:uncharacterized protein